MNKYMFEALLESALRTDDDLINITRNSCVDHHTEGLDYLCLLRNERLTVKLYHIKHEAKNRNGGYLVNPHDHKYAFETIVLYGSVEHVKFDVKPAHTYDINNYNLNTYDSITRTTEGSGKQVILTSKSELMVKGDSWFVDVHDVHTLKSTGECLLGIVQYHDVKSKSKLYLSDKHSQFIPNRSKPVTIPQTIKMIEMYKHMMYKADIY